jgi:molybdopterin-guanine dinucleotide biosynthesis protein
VRRALAGPGLAYVQIQSGAELGRVLALRRDITRLTRAGADHLVISRRDDTYALSCEDPRAQVLVNGATLEPGTEMVLADAVVIESDELRCQFFCGGSGAV